MASLGPRASRHTSLSPTAPSYRSKWRITRLISPSSPHSPTAPSRARRFGMLHPQMRLRSRNLRVAPLHSFRGVPRYRHQSHLPLLPHRHLAGFHLSGGLHRVHERSGYRLPRLALWKVVSPPAKLLSQGKSLLGILSFQVVIFSPVRNFSTLPSLMTRARGPGAPTRKGSTPFPLRNSILSLE